VPAVAMYGPIFGIICQPFWFITSWQNKQWGIFALAVWYLFVWTFGFYNHLMLGSYTFIIDWIMK